MRVRHLGRSSAVVAVVLLVPGCATPGTRTGEMSTAPGSVPASAPASPATLPEPTGPQADAPPNHRDNNGWKERRELSVAEQRTGQELAARIRPKLAALRAARNLTPAATRQALLDLGISPDAVEVSAMRPPIGAETPPPGAVYAVRFAAGGCVIGDVRPERVMVEVTGSAAEFGCLEPFSH